MGNKRLVWWFRDYCTRISGPRVWKNTLLSVCALAQGNILSNCSKNVESIIEYFENIAALASSNANRIMRTTITCTSRKNMETGGFQKHQATYCINNCYWISKDQKIFELCINNASCRICSTKSWFGSHQLCLA